MKWNKAICNGENTTNGTGSDRWCYNLHHGWHALDAFPSVNLHPCSLHWQANHQATWMCSREMPMMTTRVINIAINCGSTVGQTNQAQDGPQAADWSSQVSVHIRVIFIPFQIIPCDKVLNPLLYCLEVRLQRKEWRHYKKIEWPSNSIHKYPINHI